MELLLTVTILVILASFSFPIFGDMAARARAQRCTSNLRNMAGAVNAFVADNGGNLPTSRAAVSETGTRTIMWTELLWPYLYSAKYVGYSGPNLPKSLSGTVFECPEAAHDRQRLPYLTNVRSYGMNHYMGDYNEMTPELLVNIPDPHSVCLLADAQNESQLRPYTINARHDDHFNVLFVDGHVQPLTYSPEMAEWKTHPFWGVNY